ncbi:hypothetical protein KCQ_16212 [Pectobacterium atrosepticum ICMP 1526]|nr:hypothetical protein KCQ_16212 [Pectobacterium atrosepticum ICMP 1526]
MTAVVEAANRASVVAWRRIVVIMGVSSAMVAVSTWLGVIVDQRDGDVRQ